MRIIFDLCCSRSILDTPTPSKVSNLFFGRTWVDSPGEMVMINTTTGDKAVLYFQPCGWFGAGWYEVDGYIYNAIEEPKILMTGKWNTAMSYQPCDMDGEPLPGTEMKEAWRLAAVLEKDKYQYTHFAHKINSFDTAPKKLLHPDRFAPENGDLSKSGAEKSRCMHPWHGVLRCDESQEFREIGDLEFGILAKNRGWIRCPRCRHFLERVDGCRYIKCRKTTMSTPRNQHQYTRRERIIHVLQLLPKKLTKKLLKRKNCTC